MKLIEVNQVNDILAEMVALFRVELRSYKGIVSKPNIEAGREEMEEYLSAKFPVFAALVDGESTQDMWFAVLTARLYGWNPSLSKRNTAVTVLLPLCIVKQRKSLLLMGMILFTITFTPTITA